MEVSIEQCTTRQNRTASFITTVRLRLQELAKVIYRGNEFANMSSVRCTRAENIERLPKMSYFKSVAAGLRIYISRLPNKAKRYVRAMKTRQVL